MRRSDLQHQFDALCKCINICIAACRCPTCDAEPEEMCTTRNGKERTYHVPRIKDGHALLKEDVSDLGTLLFLRKENALRRTNAEVIASNRIYETGA